ncbi:MAG TPA: hypothetical protein VNS09_19290 [Solirubrobacter sp.]|nr:hypothetical protein [Solirubrobacter sp.]
MTSRATPATHRLSLAATVLRLAAIAMVAAVLVWSVMFADLLHKHSDSAAALAQPSGQLTAPDGGQRAQAPAPVTTRTS